MVAVFVVALGLRLVHIVELGRTPFAEALVGDAEMYDERGRAIADGRLQLNDRPYYQDPLYPYFLGAVYAVRGHDLGAVRLLQALLAALAAVAVAVTALRLVGPPAAAVAGGLYALAPTLVFYDGQIEKTSLTVHLVAVTLLLWTLARHRGPAAWLMVGVGLGFLALLRGNFLLLLPPAIAAAWWQSGRAWRRAIALAAGIALPIVPVAARNVAVSGELVLITSQGGQNFYTGNHPGNRTGTYVPPPFVRPDARFEETDFLHEAERRTGRQMSASEVSRYWWHQGIAAVRAEPAAFASQCFMRLMWTFHPDDVGDNIDRDLQARLTPALGWPLPDVGLIVALGTVGLAIGCARRVPMSGLLLGYVLLYAATLLPFFVFGRYRLPLIAPLAIGAGIWLQGLLTRERRTVVASLVGAGVVGVALLALPPVPANEAQALSTLGLAWERSGELQRATAAYEEALAIQPANPTVNYNLATVRYRAGDRTAAEEHLRVSLASFPTPEAHALLGLLLLETDRLDASRRELDLAIERAPRLVQATYWKALLEERTGHLDRARALHARVIELEGPDGRFGRLSRRWMLDPATSEAR